MILDAKQEAAKIDDHHGVVKLGCLTLKAGRTP
jgi:hypothetical protein